MQCGDATVDTGEVCDDGNQVDGDGCSRTCTSNEVCGNGTIDRAVGEQCDDNNAFARDGCSKQCVVERFEWRVVSNTAIPERRSETAIAYDSARGRFVLFGGRPVNADIEFSDTWELHGATWIRRPMVVHPRGRRGHAMAYDASRGRVVLFGGTTADTWEYDGTSWIEIVGVASPPAQTGHAMTYDAARRRIVLVGVDDAGNPAHWEYDGVSWALRGLGPPTRSSVVLAYDPLRDQLVLNGRRSPPSACETWVFDATASSWQQNLDAGTLCGGGIYFDVANQRLVLVAPLSGMWRSFSYESAGSVTTWTQLPSATPVKLDTRAIGAGYDLARRRGVFHVGSYGKPLPEIWQIDDWTPLPMNPSPPPRSQAMMAYDSSRQRTVLFGGQGATGELGDTWEFDGTEWSAIPAVGPGPRSDAAMAYDPRRKRVVLLGGRSTSDTTTWVFDGQTWQPLITQSFPPSMGRPPPTPRCAALAYDDAQARLLLVAREDFECRPGPSTAAVSGTWALSSDEDAWRQVPVGLGVESRAASLTYDAARRRIVLFGGYDGLWRNNTYELDGDVWQQIMTPESPSPRESGAFAFDVARQRPFLFGGTAAGLVFGDSWDLSAATWVENPVASPPARLAPTMVYDAARARMVLFGGRAANGPLGDTWTLGYESLDPSEVCSGGVDRDADGAIGCADDDCWGTCSPLCPAGTSCPDAARCGDGVCSSENCRNCPVDCPVGTPSCSIECGDNFCDAPLETTETCAGDCGA
ncbi:MAG: DUF4215 domain-containing protein [Kofleriaceae bacterium]